MTIAVCFGLASWNRPITWNIPESKEFAVYKDAALTTAWSSGEPLGLGDHPQPYNETYYIKNIGNVAINVTALCTFFQGNATVSWSPSNEITIAKGCNGSITIILENFSVGSGSCSVSLAVG